MRASRPDDGAYRALWTFDRADYEAHLKRLSPEDRRSRFQYAVSDAQIEAHVETFLKGGGHVIGWFADGDLRAAAEVAIAPDGETAEAAFEVEPDWRGRGVGAELVNRALLWARNRGVRRLLIHTTRTNTAMLKAAKRRGATFEFDLAEAEGVIEAPRASWRSHLREARFEEEGVLRWLWDRTLRRLRGVRAEERTDYS
ncbi:MAG: GNAT family N-acetyltransferase [Rhodobacteraceae bacterium]|nr:MAG: GNAT family N-acetyltransferase [Paracoccaceae bacterium]